MSREYKGQQSMDEEPLPEHTKEQIEDYLNGGLINSECGCSFRSCGCKRTSNLIIRQLLNRVEELEDYLKAISPKPKTYGHTNKYCSCIDCTRYRCVMEILNGSVTND